MLLKPVMKNKAEGRFVLKVDKKDVQLAEK